MKTVYLILILQMVCLICIVKSRSIESTTGQFEDEDDTIVIENDELNSEEIDDDSYEEEEEEEIDTKSDLNPLETIQNLFSDNNEDEEAKKKRLHLFPLFNPSNILDPIQQKLSNLAAIWSHPNAGFGIPKPLDIWNKIQQTGSHILGTANGAIFGLGQLGGNDYPFPYRNSMSRALKNDDNYLKKILLEYKDEPKKKFGENVRPEFKGAYVFPFLLNAEEIRQFVKNVTKVIEN